MKGTSTSMSIDANEETALVKMAVVGNVDALGDLFVAYVGRVRRLLISIIGPGAPLDDLAQDVFLHVHRSIGRFRGDAGFGTWIHSITANVAISYLRKQKRAHFLVDPLGFRKPLGAPSEITPDRVASGKEMVRRLYKILESLSTKRRVAFSLFELEGLSMEETASSLGISVSTAKSRIFCARREIEKKAQEDPCLVQLLLELNPHKADLEELNTNGRQ